MEKENVSKHPKRRFGVKRWVILGLFIVQVLIMVFIPPVQPEIMVKAEAITHEPLIHSSVLGDIYLTNTMVSLAVVMIVLLLIAWIVRGELKKGGLIPQGISGALEALLEYLFNMTETTAGKWARTIFPFFATIMLMVLVSNWMEMLPFMDAFGKLEQTSHGTGAIKEFIPGVISWLVKGSGEEGGYTLIPYMRVMSTDLNFTAALALISVVMTQVIGFRAQGFRYLGKFFNFGPIVKKPIFGLIDFAAGLLELISEFAKILSFSFRLFGNVFAGSILLFLLMSMIGAVITPGWLLFEFFIGTIQAFVFGLLTMIFMSMATQGHSSEEHHE